MPVKESEILQQIRLAASKHGVVLHRNNIGAYKDPKGYYIKYGVCNPGGSDLVGWRIFDAGQTYGQIAQFVAIEVKTPTGKATPEQLSFINAVISAGGIAGVCRSVEDFLNLIK